MWVSDNPVVPEEDGVEGSWKMEVTWLRKGHGDYLRKGKYTACVKTVDTFGCDASITVDVKVWSWACSVRKNRVLFLTVCKGEE